MHLKFKKIIIVASIFATASAPYAMEDNDVGNDEKIRTIVTLTTQLQKYNPQDIREALEAAGFSPKNFTSFKNNHIDEIQELLIKEHSWGNTKIGLGLNKFVAAVEEAFRTFVPTNTSSQKTSQNHKKESEKKTSLEVLNLPQEEVIRQRSATLDLDKITVLKGPTNQPQDGSANVTKRRNTASYLQNSLEKFDILKGKKKLFVDSYESILLEGFFGKNDCLNNDKEKSATIELLRRREAIEHLMQSVVADNENWERIKKNYYKVEKTIYIRKYNSEQEIYKNKEEYTNEKKFLILKEMLKEMGKNDYDLVKALYERSVLMSAQNGGSYNITIENVRAYEKNLKIAQDWDTQSNSFQGNNKIDLFSEKQKLYKQGLKLTEIPECLSSEENSPQKP